MVNGPANSCVPVKSAMPGQSQARKLIIASLALVVCRVVSQWNSMAAGCAALLILAVLAAAIIAGMPRVRRIALFFALPVVTFLNALVFAVGTFVALLGIQGLLADGRIGGGPAWSLAFAIVPLAAAANLMVLVRPHSAPTWLRFTWLSNLASACYVAWRWRSEDPLGLYFAVPAAVTVVISLAILSLATMAWDCRNQTETGRVRPLLVRQRKHVLVVAALVTVLVWLLLVPVYRKRQVARSLEAFGLAANFGMIFPGRTLPFELPFDWYDYLGEANGAAAPESLKGNAAQAGKLLNTLPWLNFVIVNQLPADGARLLQPLAGHTRLRQIALKGEGVTDETLADAARIPALNSAVFDNALLSDDGLTNLANAQWLQRLSIRRTPISGDGLVHLKSLPRLAELDLSGTQIGDRQVAVLPQFKTLVRLSLNDTPLSDQGLAPLAACGILRLIDLTGTRVTAAGVQRLERALPACKVVWSRSTDDP